MMWELKYEFGWPAFHGHRPSIFAHSLAVRLWSALRNREWTESVRLEKATRSLESRMSCEAATVEIYRHVLELYLLRKNNYFYTNWQKY